MFSTDQQTLDDLNIFGKHGTNSIYQTFNCSTTRGGAAVLEEMFRYPLSDHKAINRRSSTIQYFAALDMVFPFQSTLFDGIEPYLANTDERTKLKTDDHSMSQKFSEFLAPDLQTTQIYGGVRAVVELLNGIRDFTSSLKLSPGHPYEHERAAMMTLLCEPDFESILERKEKLSGDMIAAYDVLLRFRHKGVIQKLLRHIHYLDAYISIANVAKERGFVFPKALPAAQRIADIIDVYHPQVKNAIPNTIRITPDGNVIFLTGANMAGKSTFMKSLSIAMYLAHMGFPVAAQQMKFAVLDGIFTTINLPDNLGMGTSHFYAEVLRVKKNGKGTGAWQKPACGL